MKNRISTIIGLLIGIAGAIGEAFILRHELVDCYPFKMMEPIDSYYEHIGNTGMIIAPLVAVGMMLGFLFVTRHGLPIVPVVVCPLVFWLVFEYYVRHAPFSSAVIARASFDGDTFETVRGLFGGIALGLIRDGLLTGFVLSVLIWLGERWIPKLASFRMP